jgi:hypothetical protein
MEKGFSQVSARFIAFLMDLILSLNFLSIGHSTGFLIRPLQEFSRFYLKLGLPGGNIGAHLLFLIFLTWIFRLFSSSILGVSLFQFFMGIRAQGDFWKKRFQAVIRGLLEVPSMFLFPLLDVGLLFGKSSVKELVVGGDLKQKSGVFFRVFLSLPMIIFFLVLASFWAFPFSSQVKTKFGLLDPPHFFSSGKKSKQFYSKTWGFKTKSYLDEEKFSLIPTYKILREGKKTSFFPSFFIYHKVKKQVASMSVGEKFPLLEMIKQRDIINPLFPFFYPSLHKTLSERSEGLKLKLKTQDDIILYVTNSLELNFQRLFVYLLNNGPFFYGALNFRQSLLKQFPHWVDTLSLEQLGDMTYLVGRNKNTDGAWESFLPLGVAQGLKFHFKWPADKKFKKDFLLAFFSKSKWSLEKSQMIKLTPFSIFDQLQDTKLSQNQRSALETYIIKFFRDLTKEAYLKQDLVYLEILRESLERLSYVIKWENRKKADLFSKAFLKNLREVRVSLKEDNLAFSK